MLTGLSGWLLGLVLGARHALEPDHLTAVSTLVVEQRGLRRGAWLGVCWGLGHTLALLAVTAALALLDARLPPGLADAFELLVAAMLVLLGVRSLRRALGALGQARVDRPADAPHLHPAGWPHLHLGPRTFATRSLAVGVVHGLAGSGALTVLVLAGLPTTSARLGYLLVFGLGSVAGMAVLSGAAGWPLARLGRSPRVARGVMLTAGAWSTGLGLVWGAPLVVRLLG